MAVHDHRTGFVAYASSTRKRLRMKAYRLCGDWHEADDLVQMTLYKVHRRWERLIQRDQLAAYTRQTLKHTYISERRRLRWKYEISRAELPDRSSSHRSTDDRMTLIAAVSRLSPRQQAVVVLRFWADLSVEQTAVMLGCSAGTVTTQTRRALAALRKALASPSRNAQNLGIDSGGAYLE